ncbi:MAG: acetyl-CoA carboxylase carboxyltransferase subunit alpha, partial [SAR324 cluster bacterium]|nr:acetyl-CoA carboxylase carboxyltransferase subunit alpha [SAR324 cluster bacterium]
TEVKHPLDFEKALVELEVELELLRDEISAGNSARRDEFAKLERKFVKLRDDIFGKLTPFQRVQLSRHFDRPSSLDFIKMVFTDFIEFSGDRGFGDDPAIVGGTAKIGETPIMVVGHEKGKTTQERLKRNFGMANPEGYRKALRLFKLAEKFQLPLITFIDTPGAYPGIGAEERGQSEAIARNLFEMAKLETPSISIVVGEGGSGGALGLGVTDRILMMENSSYSVISPEGCASILWHGAGENPLANVAQATEMMQVTAQDLKRREIIDEIIPEPAGGAHTNRKEAAELLRSVLVRNLELLEHTPIPELLEKRYQKYRRIGVFTVEK